MRSISLFRAIVPVLIASLVIGGSAGAQTLTSPPEGITVTGMGRASASPDATLIQILLSGEMFGQPTMPQPGATPGAAEMDAVAPVVSALVDAGVPEASIDVVVPPFLGNAFSGPYGPVSALVTIDEEQIGAEEIRAVINAASVGAADARLFVAGITITHTVNDCAPLIQEARQAAFDDATSLAAVEAGIAGVSIGDVVAVRDSMTVPLGNFVPPSGDGSCAYTVGSDTFGFGPFGPLPFDMTTEPEVIVYAATEVTFSIQSAATPES